MSWHITASPPGRHRPLGLRDEGVRGRQTCRDSVPRGGVVLIAVGKVSTRVLTDIANAIRAQIGTAATYQPREMAPALAALDGTKADTADVVSSKALDAIGAAIRAQNGSATRYKPAEMAAAILALEWGAGLKVRALLLEGGVLELNYLDSRRSAVGGVVERAFDVDAAGYSSANARPWKDMGARSRPCARATRSRPPASRAAPTGSTGSPPCARCSGSRALPGSRTRR